MQGVVEQVVFSDRDADVVSASVVALRLGPRESAEEAGVVKITYSCLISFSLFLPSLLSAALPPELLLRSERKAIQRPSGDRWGELSRPDWVSWIKAPAR